MEGMMKVAIMTDIQKMDFEERPIPQPKDDEVLVKLDYVGICGSDLHYYETGAIGDYVVKPPFVLGHEPGGVVVEVGKDVKHLQVGDRVALEPGKTCGQCEFCKEGKYNLCPDVVFFATPPVDGVFQDRASGSRIPCCDPGRCSSGPEGCCHGRRLYRFGLHDGFKGQRCQRSLCCGRDG